MLLLTAQLAALYLQVALYMLIACNTMCCAVLCCAVPAALALL